MTGNSEIQLNTGMASLGVSHSTGKITRLICQSQNLLVEPRPDEWTTALSDTGRNRFESLDAWGGDECFPTIGGSDLWQFRDHGSIWSKPPSLNFAHDDSCTTGWSWNESHFKRSIRALSESNSTGRQAGFHFNVNFSTAVSANTFNPNLADNIWIQSIYASHALFAADPGDLLECGVIPDQHSLHSLSHEPYSRNVLAARVFAPDNIPVASKFYVATNSTGLFFTSLIRKKLGLRIDVIQNDKLPYVGIWWCHNGWGDGRPHSTVGIEPTNLPSDGPLISLTHSHLPRSHTAEFYWMIHKII